MKSCHNKFGKNSKLIQISHPLTIKAIKHKNSALLIKFHIMIIAKIYNIFQSKLVFGKKF